MKLFNCNLYFKVLTKPLVIQFLKMFKYSAVFILLLLEIFVGNDNLSWAAPTLVQKQTEPENLTEALTIHTPTAHKCSSGYVFIHGLCRKVYDENEFNNGAYDAFYNNWLIKYGQKYQQPNVPYWNAPYGSSPYFGPVVPPNWNQSPPCPYGYRKFNGNCYPYHDGPQYGNGYHHHHGAYVYY